MGTPKRTSAQKIRWPGRSPGLRSEWRCFTASLPTDAIPCGVPAGAVTQIKRSEFAAAGSFDMTQHAKYVTTTTGVSERLERVHRPVFVGHGHDFHCGAAKKGSLVVRDTQRPSTFCSARISELSMKIHVRACKHLAGHLRRFRSTANTTTLVLSYILQNTV